LDKPKDRKQDSSQKPSDLIEKPTDMTGYRMTKDGRICFITKAGEVCMSIEETPSHDLAISVLKACPIYKDLKQEGIEDKYQEMLGKTVLKGGSTVYHSKSREVKEED